MGIDNLNSTEKFAEMLYTCRESSGISQATVAKFIGKSKKTIQNWEHGEGAPSFKETLEYMNACGANPWHYFLNYLYPETFKSLKPSSSDADCKAALIRYINAAPAEEVRTMLYFLCGNHGSSPIAVLQLFSMYLHLSLRQKSGICSSIINQYKLNHATGDVSEEHIMPNVQIVEDAMQAASTAIINGKEGYTI